MRFKFLVILFISFLSTCTREIKAEEICYYSNPNEFKKCIKEAPDVNRKIKFPLKIGNYSKYVIWEYGSSPRNFLQINLIDQKKMNILGGTNFGPFIFSKYKGKKYLEIDEKDIYYWKKKFVVPKYPYWEGVGSFEYESYEIGYIDEYGDQKKLLFLRNILNFKGDEIFSEIFKDFLNSESGETKDLNNLINVRLNKNEKELTIISSVIKTNENKEKECIQANSANFPDLILRYKKLFKTINPLRSKLDLPSNSDLKPICN
tara:strand:+ start:196 stop:978 length:783 start_codon:yes stop_codon:yes gene_type:complete